MKINPSFLFKIFLFSVIVGILSGIKIDAEIKLDRDPFDPLTIKDLKLKRSFNKKDFYQVKKRSKGEVLIKVTGIVWDKKNPIGLVVINGKSKLIENRDKISVYTVKTISRSQITFEHDGYERKVSVGEEIEL